MASGTPSQSVIQLPLTYIQSICGSRAYTKSLKSFALCMFFGPSSTDNDTDVYMWELYSINHVDGHFCWIEGDAGFDWTKARCCMKTKSLDLFSKKYQSDAMVSFDKEKGKIFVNGTEDKGAKVEYKKDFSNATLFSFPARVADADCLVKHNVLRNIQRSQHEPDAIFIESHSLEKTISVGMVDDWFSSRTSYKNSKYNSAIIEMDCTEKYAGAKIEQSNLYFFDDTVKRMCAKDWGPKYGIRIRIWNSGTTMFSVNKEGYQKSAILYGTQTTKDEIEARLPFNKEYIPPKKMLESVSASAIPSTSSKRAASKKKKEEDKSYPGASAISSKEIEELKNFPRRVTRAMVGKN